MGSQLVTIATYSSSLEAHLVRTKLESEGIETFVADDNIVTMNWLYSNAVGGVKVQVPEQEVDHAIDVLDRADHGIDSTLSQPGEVICMSCGSSDVFYEKRPRIVTFLSFFLFCIPLPFFKARWKCGKCEKTWPA